MSVVAIEGIVENGRIRLESEVRLPENTRVYVLVPGLQAPPAVRAPSPRLAHPEQAADFQMEVVPEPPDARV
jgi:hypothetical protein